MQTETVQSEAIDTCDRILALLDKWEEMEKKSQRSWFSRLTMLTK